MADPVLLYGVGTLLGLFVGSFLNVVAFRVPRLLEYRWRSECREVLGTGLDSDPEPPPPGIVWARSQCPHCGHAIRAWENIPILSFLFLLGRCSHCQGRISFRYPLVEAGTALLTLMVIHQFGPTGQALGGMLLTWSLVALSLIDYDTHLLPDDITLPLLWVGLLANTLGLFTDLTSSVIGAAVGYLSLWSVYQLFKALTGKEGMGYGDFKLLGLLGAWLGWSHIPQIILLSAVVGAVIGIGLILALGRDRNLPIPYGPYLAIAGWISLLWGDQINQAYLLWVGMGSFH